MAKFFRIFSIKSNLKASKLFPKKMSRSLMNISTPRICWESTNQLRVVQKTVILKRILLPNTETTKMQQTILFQNLSKSETLLTKYTALWKKVVVSRILCIVMVSNSSGSSCSFSKGIPLNRTTGSGPTPVCS